MKNSTGRCVLPLVLILTAGSRLAAQDFVCYAIQPGETATHAALRLTSGAQNQYRLCIKERPAAIDVRLVWWVTFCILTMLLACLAADKYCDEREATLGTMRRFADTFIREFERPLIERRVVDRPVRSRLRFAPHRGHVEILLAPNDGRTYPNLTDHRTNLEYDVERVSQVLGVESFVSDHLYAQGRWVVIRFQSQPGVKREGAR